MERLPPARTFRATMSSLGAIDTRDTTRLDSPRYRRLEPLLLCAVVAATYGSASLIEVVLRVSRRMTARWTFRVRPRRRCKVSQARTKTTRRF
jgi:hypothetical protein